MAFKVCRSSNLQVLASQMAGDLQNSSAKRSLFQPVMIQVDSVFMMHWLSLQMAQNLGIWANFRYMQAGRLLRDIYRLLSDDEDEGNADLTDAGVLRWKILQLLPALGQEPGFEQIQKYWQSDEQADFRQLKLFQLSEKIAHTFVRYAELLPEKTEDWETNASQSEKTGQSHELWQKILWNRLASQGNRQRGHMQKVILQKLAGKNNLQALPGQVFIFGDASLPPAQLEFLQALSEVIDIHCYFYWPATVPAPKGSDYHPLLISLAGNCLEFHKNVESLLQKKNLQPETLARPLANTTTLLGALQQQILTQTSSEKHKLVMAADDDSLQIHSCHNRLREVEVLKDRLLGLFSRHLELSPRDICILAPDISLYLPFLAAVLTEASASENPSDWSKSGSLPFYQESGKKEEQAAEVLLGLMRLFSQRFAASAVLDLLSQKLVMQKFGFSEDDLGTILAWLQATGIRWGLDQKNRGEYGLPEFEEFSWEHGLERLLLGYAMPEEGDYLPMGILPFDDMEGSNTLLLGNFLEFWQKCSQMAREMQTARSFPAWINLFSQSIEDFLQAESEEELAALLDLELALRHQLEQYKQARDQMPEEAEEELAPLLVLQLLQENLAAGSTGRLPFLKGGISCGSLADARRLPFKVICLLGMNDGEYPLSDNRPGFDLSADGSAKITSRREENRQTFLETLLSASHTLYISYCGQSMKDNSPLPPSVLVSELLDYLGQNFQTGPLPLLHRLQAFHPAYFQKDGDLFSYSKANCDALDARSHQNKKKYFARRPVLVNDEDQGSGPIYLKDLIKFFENPPEYFLTRSLGMVFESHDESEDRELMETDHLADYNIKATLTDFFMSQTSEEELPAKLAKMEEVLRQKGMLAPLEQGKRNFDSQLEICRNFVESVKEQLTDWKKIESRHENLPLDRSQLEKSIREVFTGVNSAAFEISEDDLNRICQNLPEVLHCSFDNLWQKQNELLLVSMRPAKIKDKDKLKLLLQYLAFLQINSGQSQTSASLFMFTAEKNQEGTVQVSFNYSDAQRVMGYFYRYLAIYVVGQTWPLPLFMETSRVYFESLPEEYSETASIPAGPDPAIHAAISKWLPNDFDYSAGESESAFNQICFGLLENNELFAALFQKLAKTVWLPVKLSQTNQDSTEMQNEKEPS